MIFFAKKLVYAISISQYILIILLYFMWDKKIISSTELSDLSIKPISEVAKIKEKYSKEIENILVDTIASILKLSNFAWQNLDIKDILYWNTINNITIDILKSYCTILWLDELNFYIYKWENFLKKSFFSKTNTLVVEAIDIGNIWNINVISLYKNTWKIYNKWHFKVSNIWIPWKWEDFCIKINDTIYLTWDSYNEALTIDKQIEVLISFSTILKKKYDDFIWYKDQLTWLITRKWFFNLISFHKRWSLVMLDIDHFKSVNDTYWHDKWDEVLKKVWEVLKSSIRSHDISCRFGWEEFVVFFPDLKVEDTLKIVSRLKDNIEKTNFNLPWWRKITISAWLTEYKDNIEKTIKIADEKLYMSKKNWRNRITV